MVSQIFGWSLFCCCRRQGRDEREREMESDQINICCLNSPFKVNMDFYHIKPKADEPEVLCLDIIGK